MSEWQTVKQYADSKGVTPQSVYKLKKEKQFKPWGAAKRLEFKREDVSRMWLVREMT